MSRHKCKLQIYLLRHFVALPRVLFQRFAKMLRGNPNGRSLFDAFVKGILENGKYLVVDGNEIRLEP